MHEAGKRRGHVGTILRTELLDCLIDDVFRRLFDRSQPLFEVRDAGSGQPAIGLCEILRDTVDGGLIESG